MMKKLVVGAMLTSLLMGIGYARGGGHGGHHGHHTHTIEETHHGGGSPTLFGVTSSGNSQNKTNNETNWNVLEIFFVGIAILGVLFGPLIWSIYKHEKRLAERD
jgi:hypothetical protein